jgi:creatinine amidohydrolase/Fe(II)-dependent formamide hydrolase-like protein
MRSFAFALCLLLLTSAAVFAQGPQGQELVEIELMTHTEIHSAIHDHGKTTVLVYNGGTEQRGPHAVLGGHTFMARAIAAQIARKLGNALVAPVLPFSANPAGGVNPKMPGNVDLTPELFQKVNEVIVESMVKNGFKNIVLMGDHGGGQAELSKLAEAMDAKYGSQGIHVYFCSDVYRKSNDQFDEWLKSKGLPPSTHGGIPDTSEMLYLEPGPEQWVRSTYKTTIGDPVLPPGQQPDPNAPRVNNGITGDPRPSTPEIGRMYIEMKVNNAVTQINKMIAEKTANSR